ncbi:MAG: hypothetical protein DLM52_10775 [Chthoniobacterales bacterium]|nr:MAG: hypothetical protein DLM52_10775 [Chthoniobacterales bacterium]
MNTSSRSSSTKRLLIALAILTSACLVSILVAGLTSLVSLADRIHPLAGQVVFWAVSAGLVVLALYGLFAYARMPPALIPPQANSGEEFDKYLGALRSRLRANPRTKDKPVETLADIESGLAELSVEADAIVRRTASTVFLSTALLQNGRLDGMIVLFTQVRMVWRIARVYVQRPSPREMLRLYANVAGTAFVASGLESLDVGQMFAPLATSMVPALKSAIPGLSGISHLLVRCVSNGAANAFLTLRVGEVARRYCALTSNASAENIRQSATADAVKHLGRIVRENGALVASKVWDSTARVFIESGVAKAEDAANAARGWFGRVSSRRLRQSEAAAEAL